MTRTVETSRSLKSIVRRYVKNTIYAALFRLKLWPIFETVTSPERSISFGQLLHGDSSQPTPPDLSVCDDSVCCAGYDCRCCWGGCRFVVGQQRID